MKIFFSNIKYALLGSMPNLVDLKFNFLNVVSDVLHGRFPGGGHGNPPQYSSLENLMDRGAWWATVHGNHKELNMI